MTFLFMITKRILGVIFIIIALLLTLAILGQLPTLFQVIINFFAVFTGKLSSSQVGEVIGHIIYWAVHFTVTIMFWKYGIDWLKKKKKTTLD